MLPGYVESETYLKLAPDIVDFSSNLPIVVIDTSGGTIPSGEDLGPTYSVIVDVDDQTDRAVISGQPNYSGPAGMRVRGRSTASFPKKQYKFETWDDEGGDLAVSLLGLPAESDWVLNAPYTDKSMMRNYVTYRWWEELGYWSPRTRFVEVFLNTDGDDQISRSDDYVGVYVLTEGIKADNDRLDIPPPAESNDPVQITGGFVIEMGNADSARDFVTNVSGQQVAYHFNDPRREELNNAQIDWMRDYITQFERALYSDTFTHPVTGKHYTEFIDVGSFVEYEIMREFTRNFDGGSTYFSIAPGGKLTMGPLWDYNWALGNVNYAEGGDLPGYRTDGWNRSYTTNLNGWSPWWRQLDRDPDYWQAFTDRWCELRGGVLADEKFLADIDANAALLSIEAADRNFERWDVLGKFTVISPPGFQERDTFQKEVDYLKDWLVDRAAWIDSQFLQPPTLAHRPGP